MVFSCFKLVSWFGYDLIHRVKKNNISLPKPALFEDINLYDLEGTKWFGEIRLPRSSICTLGFALHRI
jgi:hypothetical protein